MRFRSFTRVRPMPVPPKYQFQLARGCDALAYTHNLTGMADAANERMIKGSFRRMDITKYREEPNTSEGAEPGTTRLVEEVDSINVPDVKPTEYTKIFMQRNPPGAMPGCTTMMNSDPSMGGKVISETATFYEMCERLDKIIDWLPQDFCYKPDRKENKPCIYVSAHGIDLDDHEAFMDPEKRPGGKNPVNPKHPVMNVQLADEQERPKISKNAFMYLQSPRITELKLAPFVDHKTKFMLFLELAAPNGESWVVGVRRTFIEKVLRSYKEYATGTDQQHYYHKMPDALAKLLDGTRATVVIQSAKTAEMMYNTCGIVFANGDHMTG